MGGGKDLRWGFHTFCHTTMWYGFIIHALRYLSYCTQHSPLSHSASGTGSDNFSTVSLFLRNCWFRRKTPRIGELTQVSSSASRSTKPRPWWRQLGSRVTYARKGEDRSYAFWSSGITNSGLLHPVLRPSPRFSNPLKSHPIADCCRC